MGQKKLRREPYRRRRWRSYLGFRGKTVWDWMALLIVPLVLVVIGLVFTMLQDARQQDLESQRANQAQKIENKRAEAERELAVQRAQDEALQAYLNQMSTLLLEKDLRSSTEVNPTEESQEARALARARTLTVLSRLDPSRKTALMQFLVEADLVQRVDGREPIISLSNADLSNARLGGSDLRGADLRWTDLSDADLIQADLGGANLSLAILPGAGLHFANLSDADLSNVILDEADLGGSDLSNANLRWAYLIQADLRYADLGDANLTNARLSDADLSEARGWTTEQLTAARSLEGATMPDGQTLKSDKMPHRPTFENWLKSKNREEGKKNDGSS